MQAPNHLQEHIDTIARHEQEFQARRSRAERVADAITAFAGGFPFVVIHIVLFSLWIGINVWPPARKIRFDPPPFPLLDTVVALEAILLAIFILMRQTGLARRADEREHLMLQILLLTEKEVSAVIRINQEIANRIGLREVARDKEIIELGKTTSVDEVAQTIQEHLSGE